MQPNSWLGQGIVWATALLVGGQVARAQGQPQPVPQIPTTVQLPTFSVFTVQTTVSVPDRGAAYLGGIQRGADGSVTRGLGPLRDRGLGSSRGASGMSIGATVIDNAELDREVLSRAAAARAPADLSAGKVAEISRAVARDGGRSRGVESVAVLRERSAASAAADDRAGEIAQWLAKAEQAEREGKVAVAKVFYQLVSQQAAAPLKQYAEGRLAALSSKPAVAAR